MEGKRQQNFLISGTDLRGEMIRMHPREFHRDLKQAESDVQKGIFSRKPHPLLLFVISILFIFLIVLMVVPYYAVKLDPRPSAIPTPAEVVPVWATLPKHNNTVRAHRDYLTLINPRDPLIKAAADAIVTKACEHSRICHAKALYLFVRDHFQYVSDPYRYEYVKSAQESLLTAGGDCDDAAVLLANLLEAVGIDTRFVFIPGHVYVEAYMPNALRKYRDGDMVPLDPTCKSCTFGELPYSNKRKEYVG